MMTNGSVVCPQHIALHEFSDRGMSKLCVCVCVCVWTHACVCVHMCACMHALGMESRKRGGGEALI